MLIAFRVDASHQIGAGHGMRCLTLAKSLKTMLQNWVPDIQVTFVATKGADMLLGLIRKQGFGYIEVDAIASSVAHIPADLWIIDHYQLDQRFESELVNAGKKVMVIDDLANRDHHCDLLLDCNLTDNFTQRYQHLIPEKCEVLLGPQYALLREEFYLDGSSHQQTHSAAPRVLICFGGSDPVNMTTTALDALELCKESRLSADVVIGSSHRNKQDILERVSHCQHIDVHIDCTYMAALMRKADVMIGAGGSMHWERCISQLPGLVVTIAENQIESTVCVSKQEACVYAGHYNEVSAKCIASLLTAMLSDTNKLTAMAQQAGAILPAKAGTPEVCRQIIRHLLPEVNLVIQQRQQHQQQQQ